jgi:HEAT repeat protein
MGGEGENYRLSCENRREGQGWPRVCFQFHPSGLPSSGEGVRMFGFSGNFRRYFGIFLCLAFLSGCSQAGPPSVEECMVALENEDPYVTLGALETLYRYGPEAAKAAGRVSLLLISPDPNLAAAAAKVLGAIGPEAAPVAIPSLRKALEDSRQSPIFGPVWACAAEAIGSMGEEGVRTLLPLLESEDRGLVRAAAFGLHFGGPAAAEAVPALIRVLARNDPLTRREAIFALQGIGSAAKDAVPALISMLHCDDFHTQYWACRALAAIGPDAQPAVPVLIVLTREGVTSVRRNAAAALGCIGPGIGMEGLLALQAALSDPTEAVREQAVIALGRLGSFAAEVVPTLQAVVRERKLQCRALAAVAIWKITGHSEFAVQVIREEIYLPENQIQAISCLGDLGPEAATATPDLINLLESEDPDIREVAAETVKKIGPAAKAAIPVLERLLFDRDPRVRSAAARALQALGQPLPRALEVPAEHL